MPSLTFIKGKLQGRIYSILATENTKNRFSNWPHMIYMPQEDLDLASDDALTRGLYGLDDDHAYVRPGFMPSNVPKHEHLYYRWPHKDMYHVIDTAESYEELLSFLPKLEDMP